MWIFMRPDALSALAAVCLLAAPQQRAPAPGIERLVERIEERYEDAEITARFVQNRLSRLGSVMQTVEGRVYISTPGRMRWEYTSTSMLLVAGGRGRETYIWLPDENTVQVIEGDADDPSQYPIHYLAGRGNLSRDFDISVIEWRTPLSSNNVQLELRPRRPGAAFERLILEVDPVRGTIARLVNFDNLRNTLEYQFHEVEYDVELRDELFEFDIPAHADVIHIGS